MFLLELVLQGVRGFRELVRLRFQPGFNLITAGNEGGKTTAVEAMMRLLFPRSQDNGESLVSRSAPEASRAALVVYSDDKAYYRIIRDFSKGGVNLSKYNAATKDFALLHKDWDGAAQFMAGLTAGLPKQDYEKLFVFRHDHYTASPSASSVAPELEVRPHPASAGRSAAQETRLAELRETLRKAEEYADAEYRLESAKIRLGEIAKKLEALEEIGHRAGDIGGTLASLKGCGNLPENLNELITAHEAAQGQKMAKSDELQQDIEGLRMQLEGMPKASLWTDALFILGALVGVGSLGTGLFFLTAEQADYFFIGVLVSVGLIAAAWYKNSRKNAHIRAVQKEVEQLTADLAEVEKSFEDGGMAILACMQATASTTVEELKEKADNYRYFSSLGEEVEEQKRRLLGGQSEDALRAEYAQQQQEVFTQEKAARQLAQYAVDAYSIRQEIERIESESSGSGWDAGFGAADTLGGFDAPAAPSTGQPAMFLAELRIASRIGGIELETLIPAVEAAAQRNFSSATAGRYVRVEAGHGGSPAVYEQDDTKVPAERLSASTRELLYFCLRAGLVEALAGKLKLPFILDDPFAGFDLTRQRAACQVLRALAAKTQVVLFAANPALRAEGDAAAELK